MLGLDGAGLFHERILTTKRENRLGGHCLGLIPSSSGGVVMIVEMNYVLKVSCVPFVGQPILLSYRLDSIDLERQARRGRTMWLLYNNSVTDESFRVCSSYWR